jgi:hypothetical protein
MESRGQYIVTRTGHLEALVGSDGSFLLSRQDKGSPRSKVYYRSLAEGFGVRWHYCPIHSINDSYVMSELGDVS